MDLEASAPMPVTVTESNISFSFDINVPKTIASGGKPETVSRRDPSSRKPKGSGLPFQCVLFDCAGLIASPDNVLDELAQRAAIEALQRCAVVLFCVDSAKADWSEDAALGGLIQPKRTIHVATKADLCDEDDLVRRRAKLAGAFAGEFLAVSARQAGVWRISPGPSRMRSTARRKSLRARRAPAPSP